MTVGASRTYKLQLSDEGIAYFLARHSQLGSLVHDLVPYGVTLYVAMALLERLSCREQAATLHTRLCRRLAGSAVHFVGFSPRLADMTKLAVGRLMASGEISGRPKIRQLYIAGLITLAGADDIQVRLAYQQACEVRNERAAG